MLLHLPLVIHRGEIGSLPGIGGDAHTHNREISGGMQEHILLH